MIDRVTAALEGRYRIQRRLGEGGMAVVFLAHDERHDRPVAVKVLKPELAAVLGTERFLAEIRTTAALQHPHILPLFDSGEAEGLLYYVMPYVEGESLRDRLERERQLPVAEAVAIASQLADGLDYAHRQGIVHRDLKPGNVLLLDGKAVLADFGIALAIEAVGGDRLTRTGMSPGTPAYMSPEQAAGEAVVGPRADIYALGCVLYEMLAGRPPYTGATARAVLAKAVTGAPTPVSGERPSVPANVDAAIARALEKVPADRFQSAADFQRALANPTFRHGDPDGDPGPAVASVWAARAGWLVAAVLALVMVGAWLARDRTAGDLPLRYGSVVLPEGTAVPTGVTRPVDLSPTGDHLAFVVQEEDRRWLYVRDLSARSAEPLTGPGPEVGSVAFSPDGEWIAFHDAATGHIRKVPSEGGVVETIGPTDPEGGVVSFRGLTWGPDGTVVFSATDRLWRIPETGGVPEPLIVVEPGVVVHTQPEFLPDGTGVVYTIAGAAFPFRHQVAVLRFGGEPSVLTEGHSPRVTRDGFLIVARGGLTSDLWAAPLADDYTALAGEPVPVFEQVGSGGSPRRARFDVAADGTLAFLPAETWAADALVWVDRQGVSDTILTLDTPQLPRDLTNIAAPRLSPDGDRLVFRGSGGTPLFRLFTYDLERTVLSSIPVDANADWPVWTPDGDRVVFNRFDEGGHDLYVARADGAGRPRPFQSPNRYQQHALGFAPDGRLIAQHREYTRAPDSDIVMLTPGGGAGPETLVDGPGLEIHAALSPDGRWLAYVSDVSGQREVYVTDFPSATTRTKVSTESAEGPAWSPDGRELFFRHNDDGAMMAVDVSSDSLFRAGTPRALFVGRFWACCVWGRSYDVARDGRFLMVTVSEETRTAPRVDLVQGWIQSVRDRAAPPGKRPGEPAP